MSASNSYFVSTVMRFIIFVSLFLATAHPPTAYTGRFMQSVFSAQNLGDRLYLPMPFSFSLSPSSSFFSPLFFPPFPFPPLLLRSRAPKSSYGVWGNAVSFLSRVWGGTPAEIEFGVF